MQSTNLRIVAKDEKRYREQQPCAELAEIKR